MQIENAGAGERVWSAFAEIMGGMADGNSGLAETARRTAELAKSGAMEAAERAGDAKWRLERLRNGEDVIGGFAKPIALRDVLRAAG